MAACCERGGRGRQAAARASRAAPRRPAPRAPHLPRLPRAPRCGAHTGISGARHHRNCLMRWQRPPAATEDFPAAGSRARGAALAAGAPAEGARAARAPGARAPAGPAGCNGRGGAVRRRRESKLSQRLGCVSATGGCCVGGAAGSAKRSRPLQQLIAPGKAPRRAGCGGRGRTPRRRRLGRLCVFLPPCKKHLRTQRTGRRPLGRIEPVAGPLSERIMPTVCFVRTPPSPSGARARGHHEGLRAGGATFSVKCSRFRAR